MPFCLQMPSISTTYACIVLLFTNGAVFRHRARTVEATFEGICHTQRPASYYEIKHPGLIGLLRQALTSQPGSFRAALSGPFPFSAAKARLLAPALRPSFPHL
jgi:hypothetical protein